MLKELLELQKTALGLIQAAVSSVLKSKHSVHQVTAGAAYELVEELKRIIYTRRIQVFRCKHLSRILRRFEAERSRGKLMPQLDLNRLDMEPKPALEEQLANLVHGEGWVRIPLQQAQISLLDASVEKRGPPTKQRKPEEVQRTAARAAQASRTLLGSNPQRFNAPPRFRGLGRFSKVRAWKDWVQESLEETDASHNEQIERTAFCRSYGAQSLQGAQAVPHQPPTPTSPPSPALTELRTAFSKLVLSRHSRQGDCPPGSAASLAARPQPAVPEADETWEASWRKGDTELSFDAAKEAPWSP